MFEVWVPCGLSERACGGNQLSTSTLTVTATSTVAQAINLSSLGSNVRVGSARSACLGERRAAVAACALPRVAWSCQRGQAAAARAGAQLACVECHIMRRMHSSAGCIFVQVYTREGGGEEGVKTCPASLIKDGGRAIKAKQSKAKRGRHFMRRMQCCCLIASSKQTWCAPTPSQMPGKGSQNKYACWGIPSLGLSCNLSSHCMHSHSYDACTAHLSCTKAGPVGNSRCPGR